MTAVDWTYYKTVYLGTKIPEHEFAGYERKARAEVMYITSGKADDRAKDAVCAVADVLKDEIPAGIVSEKVGGHSVTYRDGNTVLYNAAAKYLSGTGLLYTGVGRC